MAALEDEAEALAWGLTSGIVGVDEVIRWADLKVMSMDAPHWTLCDVATSRRLHPLDLASLLRAVPGEPNPEVVHDLRVRLMLRTLNEGDQFARVVAKAIDHAYLGDWFDDVGLGNDGDSVFDTLECAVEGTVPVASGPEPSSPAGAHRATVIAGMRKMLRRHLSQRPRPMFDDEPDI